MNAKEIKKATGLSLPVCKIIAGWVRTNHPYYSAWEREGRVPKLIRRARRALVIENSRFSGSQTDCFTLCAVGPKGRQEIG
jgi:hypothetical protein